MKKAIKYFLLALLIVPCALVFSACGKGELSVLKANELRYKIEKAGATNRNDSPENWTGWQYTFEQTKSEKYYSEVTYNETAEAEESTTEKMEFLRETTLTETITRVGQDNTAVLKVVVKKVVVETRPTVKNDLLTNGKTVTTTTDEVTHFYGIVAATEVDGEDKYYGLSESKQTVETVIDGEKAPAEEAQEPVKTKREFSSKDELFSDMRNYGVLNFSNIYDLLVANRSEFETYSIKEGENTGGSAKIAAKCYDTFEGVFESEDYAVEIESCLLKSYTHNNKQLGVDEEGLESVTEEKVTITSALYDGTLALPELTGYEDNSLSTDLLSEVLGLVNSQCQNY